MKNVRWLFRIGMISMVIPLGVIFSLRLNAQGRYGTELHRDVLRCISSESGDLYSGIDNYLEFNGKNTPFGGEILIESTNGYVGVDSNGYFLAIPDRPGKVRYTISGTDKNDSLIQGYNFFNVRRVPDPQLMIDTLLIPFQGTISKAFLLYSDSLSVYITDDIPGSGQWMRITEFTLGYNYGGFHVSYRNPSNLILRKTKEVLNTLGPDREISIKATVESDGKVTRALPIYRLMIY